MAVVGEFFSHLFSQVWRVLDLNMPVFNIPIWSVWVGIFVIELAIRIFREIVGLTSSTIMGEEVRRWYHEKPYQSKVRNTSIERRN